MTVATRRVSRLVEADPVAEPAPTSASLRADLARLDAERAEAERRLEEMTQARSGILLTGDDDQADAHDQEMARVRRTVERADLRRPSMVETIAAVEKQERDEATAKLQADARALVNEVITDLQPRYRALADELAGLLARWTEAAAIARAAGVETPDDLVRKRERRLIQAAYAAEETYTVYVDADGMETNQRFPPGSYDPSGDPSPDQRTAELPYRMRCHGHSRRERVEAHASRTKTRIIQVPAKYEDGFDLGPLAAVVRLPGLTMGEADFWPRSDSSKPAA